MGRIPTRLHSCSRATINSSSDMEPLPLSLSAEKNPGNPLGFFGYPGPHTAPEQGAGRACTTRGAAPARQGGPISNHARPDHVRAGRRRWTRWNPPAAWLHTGAHLAPAETRGAAKPHAPTPEGGTGADQQQPSGGRPAPERPEWDLNGGRGARRPGRSGAAPAGAKAPTYRSGRQGGPACGGAAAHPLPWIGGPLRRGLGVRPGTVTICYFALAASPWDPGSWILGADPGSWDPGSWYTSQGADRWPRSRLARLDREKLSPSRGIGGPILPLCGPDSAGWLSWIKPRECFGT